MRADLLPLSNKRNPQLASTFGDCKDSKPFLLAPHKNPASISQLDPQILISRANFLGDRGGY